MEGACWQPDESTGPAHNHVLHSLSVFGPKYKNIAWCILRSQDPRSLEQLTGLSRLHAQAEAAAAKLAGIASEGDGNEADAQHTHVSQGDVPAEDGEDEWLEL